MKKEYTLQETVFESDRSRIIRGQYDGEPAIFKQLKKVKNYHKSLNRFQYEYGIVEGLDSEFTTQAVASIDIEQIPTHVYRDIGGTSLQALIETKGLAPAERLWIGKAIAEGLQAIHQKGIVHKDINPGNIVVNLPEKKLNIIDFGISTTLDREDQTDNDIASLEGTVDFMSPEQTGRLKQPVDYRSDFFSFGCLLFNLFTKQLPFSGNDTSEKVHQILASKIPHIHDIIHGTPRVISDIVEKLLEKSPEDRYMSANGIAHDLDRCLKTLLSDGSIEAFEIGSEDQNNRFEIPSKLYGRDLQVARLIKLFDVVSSGGNQAMLVTGPSGIGKSAIVHQLHKPIVEKGGIFVRGKFEQFAQNVPYSALTQCVEELVKQLITLPKDEIDELKSKVTKTLGPNLAVIVDIFPIVATIFGPQPSLEFLETQQARARLRFSIGEFFAAVGRPQRPLVAFIDDLQWADAASLEILEILIGNGGPKHLLVVGAYRDNEVGPTHQLALKLDQIRKTGIEIAQIHVENLSEEHVGQLLSETLKCDRGLVEELTNIVIKKTHGNPFFVQTFLKFLFQEGNFNYSFDSRRWHWSNDEIARKEVTQNVVDLLLHRLDQLGESTCQVLMNAACIGTQFDLETLSVLIKRKTGTIARDLWPALTDGLITPVSKNYRIMTGNDQELAENVTLRFTHDRVQQAAHELMDRDSIGETHFRMGCLIAEAVSVDDFNKRAFEIADHLNLGLDTLDSEKSRLTVFRANRISGDQAQASGAFDAARTYFGNAKQVCTESDWSAHYHDMCQVFDGLSRCQYAVGDFKESLETRALLLKRLVDPVDKALAYEVMSKNYEANMMFVDCLKASLKGLDILGITVDYNLTQEEFYSKLWELKFLITEDLLTWIETAGTDEPPSKEWQAIFTLIAETHYAAFVAKPFLICHLFVLALQKAWTEKTYPNDAYFLMNLALLLLAVKNASAAKRIKTVANRLQEKNAQTHRETRYLVSSGFYTETMNNDFEYCCDLTTRAYASAAKYGDTSASGIALYTMHVIMLLGGHFVPEILKSLDKFDHFIDEHPDFWFADLYFSIRQLVKSLAGETESPRSFSDDRISAEKVYQLASKSPTGLACYRAAKCFSEYFAGEFEACVKLGHDNYVETDIPAGPKGMYHFFSVGLSIIACLRQGLNPLPKADMELKLKSYIESLRFWQDNYEYVGAGFCTLLEAEYSDYKGEGLTALKLYEAALISLQKSKKYLFAAHAHELIGFFYERLGAKLEARNHFLQASSGYQQFGSNWLAQKVNDHLGAAHYQSASLGLSGRRTATTTAESRTMVGTISGQSDSVDFETVMKATQSIVSEMNIDKLLVNLLHVVMENAGANSGYLISCYDSGLVCEVIGKFGEGEFSGQKVYQAIDVDSGKAPIVPASIVRYVEKTREVVTLNQRASTSEFRNERYFEHIDPKACLCFPVINGNNLLAILYLENHHIENSFTEDRMQVLRILAAQCAIALSNARYVQDIKRSSDKIQGLINQLEKILIGTKSLATMVTIEAAVKEAYQVISNEVSVLGESICSVLMARREKQDTIYFYLNTDNRIVQSRTERTLSHEKLKREQYLNLSESTLDGNLLVFPIRWQDETLGVMIFESDAQLSLGQSESGFVETLLQSLSLSLRNIEYQLHLEDLVKERTEQLQMALKEVTDKKQKIQVIMDNIDQGILTFDEKAEVDNEYSAYLPQLFDSDAARVPGQNVVEYIFGNADMPSNEFVKIREIIHAIMGEDELNWELNSIALPSEYTATISGSKKIIGVDWNPIFNESILERMMVTLRDLTRQKFLEQKATMAEAEQEKKMAVVGQMLKVDRTQLSLFLDSSAKRISEVEQANVVETVSDTFRNLHTIKGTASILDLSTLATLVHELENELPVRGKAASEFDKQAFSTKLTAFKEELGYYQTVYSQVFSDSSQGDNWNLHFAVGVLANSLYKRSEAGGLEFSAIEVEDSVGTWPKHAVTMLTAALPHCLNNALDHGYLIPNKAKKKINQVELNVTGKKDEELISITINDRGVGLNHSKLKDLAKARGLESTKYMEVLFMDGASTSENVTLTSGRGVGLGAVRQMAIRNGGDVRIVDREGGGTRCIITLSAASESEPILDVAS